MAEGINQIQVTRESQVGEKRIGAMVLNDRNDLLLYTCRSTVQACEESAENGEFFVEGVWEIIKKKGARVVQVEVTIIK